MPRPIKEYVTDLLRIVTAMQADYAKKKFTLDGRLVGDIGEILAEQLYEIELMEGMSQLHDATASERRVQIKTTMKQTLGFGDVPDYYLGIRVDPSGEVEEIFNGPGAVIWDAIKHRKRPKNYLFNVGISRLRKLNKSVLPSDRIPIRPAAASQIV